jgi:hypothetical protein
MLYFTVYVCYICISMKSALSGPQNQLFNCIIHSVTLHKTSCIHIHFWEWVTSNQNSSTEEACSRVLHIFNGLISMFVPDILQNLVGTWHPLAYPWLQASLNLDRLLQNLIYYKHDHKCLALWRIVRGTSELTYFEVCNRVRLSSNTTFYITITKSKFH